MKGDAAVGEPGSFAHSDQSESSMVDGLRHIESPTVVRDDQLYFVGVTLYFHPGALRVAMLAHVLQSFLDDTIDAKGCCAAQVPGNLVVNELDRYAPLFALFLTKRARGGNQAELFQLSGMKL